MPSPTPKTPVAPSCSVRGDEREQQEEADDVETEDDRREERQPGATPAA